MTFSYYLNQLLSQVAVQEGEEWWTREMRGHKGMLLHATETWPIDGVRHNGLLWKEEHPLLKEEVVQNSSLPIIGGLELGNSLEMGTE